MDTAQFGLRELLPPLIFMVVMLFLFWWIIMAPAKKRQKRHQDLIQTIGEGEEIVTVGGIYGRVVKVREDSVDVEVAQGVRLKLDRRALRRRAAEEDEK